MTETETQSKPESRSDAPARQYKRRRKFIRRDLQLKIIFGSLFVAFLVLVFNFQVPLIGMWVMRETSEFSLGPLYGPVNKLLLTSFGISFLLTIPLSIWMGVVFSFQFCGPIYRMKKYFDDMKDGRWDEVCRLRENDDLQDVKDSINEFMTVLTERVDGQHAVLQHAYGLLKAPTRDPDEVEKALRWLEAEAKEYKRRRGEPVREEVESEADSDSESEADLDAPEGEPAPTAVGVEG